MAKIYKYRKYTDEYTTYCLVEPDFGQEEIDRPTELCTIDGITYVSVPDSITLPPQPEQIVVYAVDLILDPDLLASIRAVSPHILLINDRVVERIRARYSVNDEIKMLRTGPTPETDAYNDYVEECRAWGRNEKETLGL